jgi:hypothetical protein
MYPILTATARIETDGANETLRRYARWEYGGGTADWLLAAARGLPVATSARRTRPVAKPSLRGRVRAWFGGLSESAALDVRRLDEPTDP